MFWKKQEKTPAITPNELAEALSDEQSPVLVDVRSTSDFQKGHLYGAINIPLDELEQRANELDPSKRTVFY